MSVLSLFPVSRGVMTGWERNRSLRPAVTVSCGHGPGRCRQAVQAGCTGRPASRGRATHVPGRFARGRYLGGTRASGSAVVDILRLFLCWGCRLSLTLYDAVGPNLDGPAGTTFFRLASIDRVCCPNPPREALLASHRYQGSASFFRGEQWTRPRPHRVGTAKPSHRGSVEDLARGSGPRVGSRVPSRPHASRRRVRTVN